MVTHQLVELHNAGSNPTVGEIIFMCFMNIFLLPLIKSCYFNIIYNFNFKLSFNNIKKTT